jgi:hypothetical protein
VFKFLDTNIYSVQPGSLADRSLSQRYKDARDAAEYRMGHSEYEDDTAPALPNPYRMSGADWDAAAKEMIKSDMGRWNCFNDWNYFWKNFDVYRRYRYSFKEAIAEMWADPSSRWYAGPGAGEAAT